MEINKQSANFYREIADKKEYFVKNNHGNILSVNKVILMELFGYVFTRQRDTATEDNIGKWKKVLPAKEGFSVVEKKDWEKMETERLKGIAPIPVKIEEKIEMGPDEGKRIKEKAVADAKAEADKIIKKAKADAKVKADAITKKAEDEAIAKAEAEAQKGNK